MNELKVGDYVRTSQDGQYSEVYMFGHWNPGAVAKYLRIRTPSASVEISESHMMEVKGRGFIPASMIGLGDIVSNEEEVVSIKEVERKGIFAPFTRSGTIRVDDVVCSNYISLQPDSANLMMWGSTMVDSGISWQWILHSFMRVYTSFFDIRKDEYTEDGISVGLMLPWKVSRWVLGV
mmetsp:Transcript_9802/g.14088  ORF Transcript_9802/g.14088 Transcript_9802/m.14088 type:complete len:178 (+) Transcript_9802:3-536(+)